MSFFEIFQPGLKHLTEERDRQKMLVSKPTHGGGAPLGIDLDGGIAKFTVTRKAPPPEEDPSEQHPPGGPDAAAESVDVVPADDA